MKPIVCVTEFNEYTDEAVLAADRIARRLNERLILVRSVDEREQFAAGLRDRLMHEDERLLAREAERLRQLGFDVEPHVLHGVPDDSVAKFAQRASARLIVLGCAPLSRTEVWVLGCTAEQIATTAEVPLLLVRSAAPFVEWAAGTRALRVHAFVGPEHLPAVQHVLAELREVEREEVELHGTPSDARRHPKEAAAKCATAARERGADLIVISTHPHRTLPLLPHASLPGCLLRQAPLSVLCVPDLVTAGSAEHSRSKLSGREPVSHPSNLDFDA